MSLYGFMALATPDTGLLERPQTRDWLEPLSDPALDVGTRRETALANGLLAVFFDEDDIAKARDGIAAYDVATGIAVKTTYTAIYEGGRTPHLDITNAITHINDGVPPKVDGIKIKSYKGQSSGDPKIITEPETFGNIDDVTGVDDGLDTAGTIRRFVSYAKKHGIDTVRLRVGVTKQPRLELEDVDDFHAMFATPRFVWGESYGFGTDGMENREKHVIGMSMAQEPDNYDHVEAALDKLGDVAIATMDEVIEFNRQRLEL